MKQPPIIGRDYYPPPTLRRMPRHWVLEESRAQHAWRWWLDPDVWVGLSCICVVILAIAGVLQ